MSYDYEIFALEGMDFTFSLMHRKVIVIREKQNRRVVIREKQNRRVV